jgi:AraC-like DNA-binding protein
MPDWSQFLENISKGGIQLKLHSFNNHRHYERGMKNDPRFLPWHRIHLVSSGTIVREINGKSFIQKSGGLVWQFPHTLSRFEFPGPCDFYGLHFDMNYSINRSVMDELLTNNHIFLADASSYFRDIQEICTLYNQNRPINPIRSALRLSDLLCRIVQDSRFPHEKSPLSNDQKAHILNYIHENCHREIHSHEVAESLNYSSDYFCRLFKGNFGVSFRRYQMEERIRMAGLELMTSDMGISNIAEKYGYHDIALFSRQFKVIMGISPRQYRKTML